jgi:hypothetical protein
MYREKSSIYISVAVLCVVCSDHGITMLGVCTFEVSQLTGVNYSGSNGNVYTQ